VAVYYEKIANNMPRVILTSRDELVPVKKYKYFLWVGLALNTVGPIGEGIFLYLYLHSYHTTRVINFWFYTVLVASTYAVYTGQVISGIQLIRAVRNIRKFLSLSASKEQLSMRTLLLHLLSFGGFLVSIGVLMIAYTVYLAFPSDAWASDFYFTSNIVWEIAAVLSQLLLCTIFWILTDHEKEIVTSDEPPVTEFGAINEESQVQARVWNSFLKQSYVLDHDSAGLLNYSVTPQ